MLLLPEPKRFSIETASPFLLLEGDNAKVMVSTTEAILGDKLTAFAPNTTGVPYGREKEVEIIKQLYDIGLLFDIVGDVGIISAVFNEFAMTGLAYCEMEKRTFTKEEKLEILKEATTVI